MAGDSSGTLAAPGFSRPSAAVRTSSSPEASRIEDEVISLFEQLRAPVLRYLLSFRISVADGEEIIQEVFLALFRHLQRGKPQTNLQGWVFRAAHNAGLKRRNSIRQDAARFGSPANSLETMADSGLGPELNLLTSQRQQRLLSVVRALPERDQCCLSLRAEGLRYREIADLLGISLGSVAASLEKSMSRLTRADQTRGT